MISFDACSVWGFYFTNVWRVRRSGTISRAPHYSTNTAFSVGIIGLAQCVYTIPYVGRVVVGFVGGLLSVEVPPLPLDPGRLLNFLYKHQLAGQIFDFGLLYFRGVLLQPVFISLDFAVQSRYKFLGFRTLFQWVSQLCFEILVFTCCRNSFQFSLVMQFTCHSISVAGTSSD